MNKPAEELRMYMKTKDGIQWEAEKLDSLLGDIREFVGYLNAPWRFLERNLDVVILPL